MYKTLPQATATHCNTGTCYCTLADLIEAGLGVGDLVNEQLVSLPGLLHDHAGRLGLLGGGLRVTAYRNMGIIVTQCTFRPSQPLWLVRCGQVRIQSGLGMRLWLER